MPRFVQRNPVTGAVMFDTGVGDRMALILGTMTIDYAVNPDGSISVPALTSATPFTFLRGTGFLGTPNVSVSGSTLSWQRTKNGGGQYPSTGSWQLIYGGIDLVTLGALAGPYLNLRNPLTGKYLFSSRFATYRHDGRGTASLSGISYERADGWKITPPGAYTLATMIALRPVNRYATVMGNFYSDGAYRSLTLAVEAGWSGAGDFFSIERPSIVAAHPGFNTRDPLTGELTFSSAHQPLRVVDVIGGTEQTWVGTPGRQYAAIFSGVIGYNGDEETDVTSVGGQIVIGDDPPYYAWAGYGLAVKVPDGTPHALDFAYLQHSGNNIGVKKATPQPRVDYRGTIMIIDVTGL